MNWNKGSKPQIRTSLARARAAEPAGQDASVDAAAGPSPAAAADSPMPDEPADGADADGADAAAPSPARRAGEDDSDSDVSDSASDSQAGEVMINVASDGASSMESGELSESDGPEPAPQPDAAASDDERDDGDDMMRYADSAAPPAPAVPAPLAPPALDGPADAPTLADLTLPELRQQLRYFHAGTPAPSIALSTPARCLSCGAAGHLPARCPQRTCATCGAADAHPAALCPELQRCARCRRRGHAAAACPSKLKPAADEADPDPCALCGRAGHGEPLCEAAWRTSGRPWERDLPPGASLFCFECGAAGHLGNDCARRNPGKEPATSSWSAAACTRPARLPVRQGLGHRGLPPVPPPPAQPAARHEGGRRGGSFRYGESAVEDEDEFLRHPPRQRGAGEMHIRGLARGGSQSAGDGADRARSKRGRGGRGRGRGRGGGGDGDGYRPMPSAAAKAWRKGKT